MCAWATRVVALPGHTYTQITSYSTHDSTPPPTLAAHRVVPPHPPPRLLDPTVIGAHDPNKVGPTYPPPHPRGTWHMAHGKCMRSHHITRDRWLWSGPKCMRARLFQGLIPLERKCDPHVMSSIERIDRILLNPDHYSIFTSGKIR